MSADKTRCVLCAVFPLSLEMCHTFKDNNIEQAGTGHRVRAESQRRFSKEDEEEKIY
jgi:hypothetical protein